MVPQEILDKQEELFELVHKYPKKIPIEALAKFLGRDRDALKASLDRGSADFGFAGTTDETRGNRLFTIPTFTFYAWYTKGIIFEGQENRNSAERTTQ